MWCDYILLVAQRQEWFCDCGLLSGPPLGQVGFFWLLRGKRGCGECGLLCGLPSYPVASGAVAGCSLAVQCGMCQRHGLQDNSDRSAIAFRDANVTHMRHFARFLEERGEEKGVIFGPSMINSCWSSRTGGAGVAGSFTAFSPPLMFAYTRC